MKIFRERGITLIALVVTIVLLLILAGVTIGLITEDNGILKRAQNASEKTESASKDERIELDKVSELMYETESGKKNIEQVTDEHPGELESIGDEKIINSIEDLVVFAWNVTNGNTYKGQTVKLGLNLDFNSSKSYVDPYRTDYGEYGYNGELKILLTSGEGFKIIGLNSNISGFEEKSFSGIFDGNGKIIYSLYINQKIEDNTNDLRIGLFGNNYGEIKKLGLEDCYINGELITSGLNASIIGGIVGVNYKTINECFTSGKLCSSGTDKAWCGGISGNNSEIGNISNCYNLADIDSKGRRSSSISAGICPGSRWNDK